MIQLTGAGKRFGPRTLFEGVDWLITPNERSAIVGGNGTGKSTLLKILSGQESLDYGTIQRQKGIRVGYLPQEGLRLTGRSVFAECLSVFDDLRDKEKEMEALAHKMSELPHDGAEYAQVAERYHVLESEFLTRDGYALEAKVGAVLTGLGFPTSDWGRLTDEFSGGWQMRIALAKLLLDAPDLLLLDEPTNHLDIEARDWLEDYLKGYSNAYILISHDRYFLDVTVKKIVELWNKKIWFYTGNYAKFLTQKEERRTTLEAAYRNQTERIEQLTSWINRFRAQATKAKQVQSKIKELERIERIEPLPPEEETIHFTFPQPKQSGRVVAECKGLAKSYPTKDGGMKQVFANATFTIERGERIALVGHNGAGKSTLIKLLAGIEPLTAGTYTLGHNVALDYFAQDQYKELDPNAEMLDDLTGVNKKATQTELRGLLGCFLFSGDDVFKKIGVLSGGERNRYALARILMQPANFLLLDEPTNHLDMRAKEVLLEAIENYSGTVVFVSHDRYFLDKIATRVFHIGEGDVTVYPGNYEDYLWRVSGKPLDLPVQDSAKAVELVKAPEAAAAKPRINPMKLERMKRDVVEMEARIGVLEGEITALTNSLGTVRNAEEARQMSADIDAKRAELEKTTAKWEELSLAVEEAV
jgi:ATP-binding cassette subfamily F protein 3